MQKNLYGYTGMPPKSPIAKNDTELLVTVMFT